MQASRAPYSVREYLPQDYEAVRALYAAGLGGSGDNEAERAGNKWYVADKLKSDLADIEGSYMNKPGACFWVLVLSEAGAAPIVGRVACAPAQTDQYEGYGPALLANGAKKPCELLRMSVAEAHQRRGLGRVLIDTLEKWARGKGYDSCVLSTIANNKAAIGLYEKSGFRALGSPVGVRLAELSKDPQHEHLPEIPIQTLWKKLDPAAS
eukprot:g6301.t1